MCSDFALTGESPADQGDLEMGFPTGAAACMTGVVSGFVFYFQQKRVESGNQFASDARGGGLSRAQKPRKAE